MDKQNVSLPTYPDTKTLCQNIRHLMIDLQIPTHGAYIILARALSCRLKKTITRNTIGMAMCEYRTSAPYVFYLTEILEILRYCQTNNITVAAYNTSHKNNQEAKEDSNVR